MSSLRLFRLWFLCRGRHTELAVCEILGAIAGSLVAGSRVEIRGFGSFGLNYRPPRTGRNPKTEEKVAVPGKYVPHFKAGKEMRDLVMTTPY
ncbi:MAG: HU family DNA-binding protein [Nitrosomonas ureae]